MTKRELSDQELEALFAASRDQAPPQLSDAALAKITADAARAAQQAARPAPKSRASASAVLDWLFGALAPSTVVLAGVMGLWIGVSGPQGVPDPALLWSASDALGSETDALWFDFADLDSVEWEDG